MLNFSPIFRHSNSFNAIMERSLALQEIPPSFCNVFATKAYVLRKILGSH